MLEPLAATVLTSILPSRPLATQFLASKPAFGTVMRTATHSLPSDFFTQHRRSAYGKGKEKALPEEVYVACNNVLGILRVRTYEFVMEEPATSMTRFPSTRPRIRRSSGHKHVALEVRSHIPSLRTWMRQADVVQRRHASSRTATTEALPRRPKPPPRWLRMCKNVIGNSKKPFSAKDAWRAFESLYSADGEAPLPPDAAVTFVANLTRSVASGHQGALSLAFLHSWGKRIEDMLHHIDPGIEDMPQNDVRLRWNNLHICASAMQGRLDDAISNARMMFSLRDEARKNEQRADILQVYTVLVVALLHYQGPSTVYNFLVQESDLFYKYLAGHPDRYWAEAQLVKPVSVFSSAALDSLRDIQDPVQCLQGQLQLWSKYKLCAAASILVRAMCRAKRLRDALDVLRLIKSYSIFIPSDVFLLVVRGLVKLNLFDDASKIYASISSDISDAGRYASYHSTGLYLRSREGDVDASNHHYSMLAKRKLVNVDDKPSLMHAYATVGNPGRVVELFNQFYPVTSHSSRRKRPNIVHYTTVIFAHAQVGDLDGVNTWLNKLTETRLRPDLHVYSIILESFSKRGDVLSMTTVLDQMRALGITMNSVIYTSIISTLAKRNDPIGAERLYKRALSEGVVPDRTMVSAIMNAHVEAGSWQGAIRAFDYLNTPGRAGAGFTVEVFNTLMKAYVLIGAPFRVVANLFRQLDRVKLQPDVRTFALLIQSACDSGFMDIAEDLHKEMERLVTVAGQDTLKVNVYILTIMMNGYLLLGRRLKAKATFDKMKELDIKANAVTYAAILRAYGEQKTSQGTKVAEEFLRSLMSSGGEKDWLQLAGGRQLTLETVYRPLLNAYAQREAPEEVERLYEDMLRADGQPTLGTMTMILDAYRRTGNVDAVQAVWPEILRLGVEFIRQNTLLSPDDKESPLSRNYGTLMCVPFSILIDALSAAGKHAEVAQNWKALKDQGFQFDSHNWNHLITALIRAGEPQRAFDVVENVILRYQHQSRMQLERERDKHPESPLTLDLPSPDEGDLPVTQSEAPLHVPGRRAVAVERTTRRFRNRDSLEEKGAEDFAHPLHILHTMSPSWNTWRPHGATLILLGRVLSHLKSGRLIQAVRPNVDSEYENAAMDVEDIRRRTEAAGRVLGEIYERFPRTLRLVEEYALIRRNAGRTNEADGSS